MSKTALYWEKDTQSEKIRCLLCPHRCLIGSGKTGICRVRKNIGQNLVATNYGKLTAIALDPIEKKPLYHFKPGTDILSVGTYGCNMRCLFCQNHHISQQEAPTINLEASALLPLIRRYKNNIGIAFTYNEPLMWYEYIYDAAQAIKKEDKNISVVLVTNGYINPEPFAALLPYIDAVNIDLKFFNNNSYRRLCGAGLNGVLAAVETAARHCHLEVTTLMITGENDSEEEIVATAKYLSEISPDIPLHLSRYYPAYKFNRAATDPKKIFAAREAAKQYLNYVYVGNIPGGDADTYCPGCGKKLVARKNYYGQPLIDKAACDRCGHKIPLILADEKSSIGKRDLNSD